MPELTVRGGASALKRLSTMRPREVAYRVRERMYSEAGRLRYRMGRNAVSTGVESFRSYLEGAPCQRFYAGARDNPGSFVLEHFPEWLSRATAEAARLCRHDIQLLGYPEIHLGETIDWNRDPVTGRAWDRRYWADYQLLGNTDGRDPKIIHELNRHQHLPRLAKAFVLTGDECYAAEAVAQLNSWIDQNPPEEGINWNSSLEIAIRVIAWLWTLFPLLPSRSLDRASAGRIGDSIFAQLEHVYRYPSVYSSPNTHLIGEAAALFIGGLLFRDRKRPAAWLRRGARLLFETAQRQVLDDGVYGELSSCYHCYALDFYLQATILARQNAFPLPGAFLERVRAMLHFLAHLTRCDGTLPALGDDDGGRALALHQTTYRSFSDGLCLGSLLFRAGDLKYQAREFFEEAFWMLGERGWNLYKQLKATPPADTHVFFPRAGYFIQRSGWFHGAAHLVFDCGALGMLTGGHAHADSLSISLFSRGREVLFDAGTFVYNCAPEWRSYFRSTPAHNTVTIDGRDQSGQNGTFRWKSRFHARAITHFSERGTTYMEAEHDGYEDAVGVTHRRRILALGAESWIIIDDFRGSGEHSFDAYYHVGPEPEKSGFRLQVFGSQPLSIARIPGWISRGYGEKTPSTAIRATLRGSVPAALMTFVLPAEAGKLSSRGPAVQYLPLESGSGIACSYHHGNFEDILVFSTGDCELAVADFRFRGEFCWLRLEGRSLKQVLAVRSVVLVHRACPIFQKSEPGIYFELMPAHPQEKKLCAEFAES